MYQQDCSIFLISSFFTVIFGRSGSLIGDQWSQENFGPLNFAILATKTTLDLTNSKSVIVYIKNDSEKTFDQLWSALLLTVKNLQIISARSR